MPVATKFESEGVDNGFPFCLDKVDVSGFDYWTSLSGWSKVDTPANNSEKAQSIEDSLHIAMALFWNASEMEGLADQDTTGANVTSTGVTTLEPKDRACSKIISVSDTDATAFTLARLDLRLDIRKMYNGSEFVGYGAFSLAYAYVLYDADPEVSLSSWANEIPPDPFDPTVDDVDYTTLSHPTLGDIHLVCSALVLQDFAVNPNVDAANRLAEDLFNTARIDSIDFYTYPP